MLVERTNASDLRLYERADFSASGALPGFYGRGRDAVRMACDVAAVVVRPTA
jgi:hypothetical protein